MAKSTGVDFAFLETLETRTRGGMEKKVKMAKEF